MARTTHLRSDTNLARTLCDLARVSPTWKELLTADTLLDAAKPCRDCERIDAKREPAFVPSGPYTPAYGARELGASAARALAAPRHAEAEAPRGWASAEVAVRAAVRFRIERNHRGVPLRSSAEPSDRVQHARDPSAGGRVHAEIDRYRNVDHALDLAERADNGAEGITGAMARWIYELAVAGKPIAKPTKRGKDELPDQWTEWIVYSHEECARAAIERYGQPITEWHVTLIRKGFTAFIGDALRASGEIGARREEGHDGDRDGAAKWASRIRAT